MSKVRITQFDQINELTRGVDVPIEPIGSDMLSLIVEAIAEAWEHVRTTYPDKVVLAEEPEISALLISRLNASLNWNLPLSLVVSSVHRGSESISFNGAKFEGRPDLVFTLTKWDKRFNLVGESKIIDLPKGKTAALYRNKGIQRFVDGEYAWGTKEGLVVAYVRCGSKLEHTLLDSLSEYAGMNCSASAMHTATKPPVQPGTLGTSTHGRKFSYAHQTASVPGEIELWHLWLEI